MKVTVDYDMCASTGGCMQICPEVFALDDEGHATVAVDVVPVELEDKARQAVVNCPERAISVD